MQTSVIRQRVADFLKRHPPFDSFANADLLELAGSGKVKFHQSEEYVYQQGAIHGNVVWVIQQGRVDLLDGERICDVLGEGDILGLDQFTGNSTCLWAARTANDVILYGIAAPMFESAMARYPAVRRFVDAHSSVSGVIGFNRASWLESEPPPLEFLRARGAEIVALTAGRITAPISTREVVREMLRSRCENVGVTDGDSTLLLTAADLALFCNHNPARIIAIIRNANSLAEMTPLLGRSSQLVLDALAQPRDVDDCCRLNAEVLSAAAEACIRLAEEDVKASGIDTPPPIPYCWAMFGASARADLMQPCLPTIAAIYDDSDNAVEIAHTIYFAAVAGETLSRLYNCGLIGTNTYWPEGVQPSMPLSEWKRLYSETIRNPIGVDLYARREFFDLSLLSGDSSILRELQDTIAMELRDHDAAVPILANDTLANLPPLTFFQGLVVDLEGGQHEGFDISDAVIAPISNAARVFAMAKHRLTPANTLDRLEAAQLDFPESVAILREAADAFRIGLYYQTLAGGSRINPAKLAKFDQALLKTAFASIQRFLEFTDSSLVPVL